MTVTRVEVMEQLGYTMVDKASLIRRLEARGTKTAQDIIKRMQADDTYAVMVNRDYFTVLAYHLVTKDEQKQFQNLLGVPYKRDNTVAELAGKWDAYRTAPRTLPGEVK